MRLHSGFGHGACCPPSDASNLICSAQYGQFISMGGAGPTAATAFFSAAGASDNAANASASTSATGAVGAGITTGFLHDGHRTRLPSSCSRTLRPFWQFGHLKRIGMMRLSVVSLVSCQLLSL